MSTNDFERIRDMQSFLKIKTTEALSKNGTEAALSKLLKVQMLMSLPTPTFEQIQNNKFWKLKSDLSNKYLRYFRFLETILTTSSPMAEHTSPEFSRR